MDPIIPKIEEEFRSEAPKPNIKLLGESQGVPTNNKELKTIIIDKFGLSKVALNTYLKGVAFLKSQISTKDTFTYNGKTGSVPEQDKPIAFSSLNTPIWDYLLIEGDTYEDRTYGTITYDTMRIDSILITISQNHNLVLTEVQGRDNEVIEYVGKSSFRINFKGGIYGKNNNRPKNDISNLKKILNSNKPLKIQYCGFLSEWDISQIYVLDKSIPQEMGGYNYQVFEFNAIQSVPVILASKQVIRS